MRNFFLSLLGFVVVSVVCIAVYLGLREFGFISGDRHSSNVSTDNQEEVEYQTIQETEPANFEERMQKAEYFFEKGFLSLAATEYAYAARLDNSKKDPLLKLGQIYIELEEYKKAEDVLQRVFTVDSKNEDAIVMLGQIHIKKSDFPSAKEYFALAPKTPGVLYYLGLIEAIIGDSKKSKNYLEQSKKSAESQKLRDNIDELLKSFAEFSLFPDSEVIYFKTLLARSLDRIDEFEMAVFVLREVLKEKVDYRDAWILLGYAYLSLEKIDFALTAFEKAYQIDPENAEVQYFLGLTYAELNKLKEAIIYLNIALKNGFEPQVQAKQKLAELYFDTEEYEKSVQMYEEVLSLNDTNVDVFVRPVWIYLDYLKQSDKALSLAQKALKQHPKDAMAFNLAGWTYSEQGELTKAEKYLKNAIALDGSLAAAYLNLGNVYQLSGKNNDALNFFKKAYNLDRFGSIGKKAAENYNTLVIQ